MPLYCSSPKFTGRRVGRDPGNPEGTLKAATKHANGNEYLTILILIERFFLSFSPSLILVVAGLERGKNPARKVLRLIQDLL